MRKLVLVLGLLIPGVSLGGDGIISRIVNGTCNEVCTSFVDEVRIEKRAVRVCVNGCPQTVCQDVAVTYRKKVWIEKVPTVQCVAKTVCVTECQCINGCLTPVQKQVVVNQPTVTGYTDRIIRCGIPRKVCEQPVSSQTGAPPLAQ
jgi:hypothetical protein